MRSPITYQRKRNRYSSDEIPYTDIPLYKIIGNRCDCGAISNHCDIRYFTYAFVCLCMPRHPDSGMCNITLENACLHLAAGVFHSLSSSSSFLTFAWPTAWRTVHSQFTIEGKYRVYTAIVIYFREQLVEAAGKPF